MRQTAERFLFSLPYAAPTRLWWHFSAMSGIFRWLIELLQQFGDAVGNFVMQHVGMLFRSSAPIPFSTAFKSSGIRSRSMPTNATCVDGFPTWNAQESRSAVIFAPTCSIWPQRCFRRRWRLKLLRFPRCRATIPCCGNWTEFMLAASRSKCGAVGPKVLVPWSDEELSVAQPP